MRRMRSLPGLAEILEKFNYDPHSGLLTNRKTGRQLVGNSGAGYYAVSIGGGVFGAHRIVWKILYGIDPIGEIDHVNGNRKDNRPENLRECSSSQNNQNRRMSRRNKSGAKGVHWEKARRKWRAVIYPRLIGRFDSLEEAQKALVAARELAHGEFANHGLGY